MGELVDVFVVLRRYARFRPLGRVPILLDGRNFPGVTQHGSFSRGGLVLLCHWPLSAHAMMMTDESQLNIFGTLTRRTIGANRATAKHCQGRRPPSCIG